MSFIQSIKGTLSNVQREIGVGFKTFTTSAEPSKPKRRVERKTFNENAGAGLLHRYQECWKEIHVNCNENAKKAQELDADISSTHKRLEDEHSAMSTFNAQVSSLPQLTQQLNDVVSQISALTEKMADIENMLVTLEDLCEQDDMRKNKLSHNNKLTAYRQGKHLELEKQKVMLSRQHARHVQAFESKLQRNLKERQEAFEATYREEINSYKTTGQTTLKPNITGEGPSLGDIDVGQEDRAVLDEFLKSDADEPLTEQKPESPSAKQEDPSGEPPDNTDFEIEVTPDQDISEQDLKDAAVLNNNTEAKDESTRDQSDPGTVNET